jgi:5'-3' exonuclease
VGLRSACRYKGHRAPTPPEIVAALQALPRICRALGLRTIVVPGVEADDAIATLATVAEAAATEEVAAAEEEGGVEGGGVVIVSKDKDMAQLLSPHVTQLVPGNFGRPDVLHTAATFIEEHGTLATIRHPSL